MSKYHERKSIRLKEYDYSLNGYYFVTVCTRNKMSILAEISFEACRGGYHATPWVAFQPKVILSEAGQLVDESIKNISITYHDVRLDSYVIMPNHIHLIVVLSSEDAGTGPDSIPDIIRSLKTVTSKRCGQSLWQRGYYEHIIRNKQGLQEIRQYIENNPAKWAEDKYYHV